jgi:dsRNA-specific ribonuclease
MEILEVGFDLSDSPEFWLEKLENSSCRYPEDQKIKRFSEIANLHTFKHKVLLYQAFHHPSYLTPEAISSNYNYVNSSYHRLSFLGEALISMIVSKWVYSQNPGIEITENILHKLKICGINHHIISLMSIDLGFDSAIYSWNNDLREDLKRYKEKIAEKRQYWDSPKRIKKEDYSDLDIEFTVILCEVFYSYWGAVLLDTKNLPITIEKFKKVCEEYLLENATLDNYTEHPKVEILELFFNRRNFFKEIKEK